MSERAWGKFRDVVTNVAWQPLLGRMSALAEALEDDRRQEDLAMKIAAAGGGRAEVWAEIERRTEVFADAQRSCTDVRGNPRTSALESVLRDVTEGKL